MDRVAGKEESKSPRKGCALDSSPVPFGPNGPKPKANNVAHTVALWCRHNVPTRAEHFIPGDSHETPSPGSPKSIPQASCNPHPVILQEGILHRSPNRTSLSRGEIYSTNEHVRIQGGWDWQDSITVLPAHCHRINFPFCEAVKDKVLGCVKSR